MPRVAREIKCNENDILALESIVANPLSDPHIVMKATALLLCIRGMENKDVAAELGVRKNTVGDCCRTEDQPIQGLKAAQAFAAGTFGVRSRYTKDFTTLQK